MDIWGNWIKEDWMDVIWRMVENAEVDKIRYEEFVYLDDKAQNLMLKQVFSQIVYESKCFAKNNLCCWHSDQNPSLYYDFTNHNFHCFGCMRPGEHRDVIDFAQYMLHTNKYHEAHNFLIESLVEGGEKAIAVRKQNYKNKANKSYTEENAKKALLAYAPYALSIKSTRDFLSKKTGGLTDDVVYEHYFKDCKYCSVSGQEYIAIKCDNGYFAKRCIDAGSSVKYMNFKGEEIQLFNGKHIDDSSTGDVIVIVESALDAILLGTSNVKAVAINGVNNEHLLKKALKKIDNPDFSFIIMMDNDEAGRRASKRICAMLCKIGVKCYEHYRLCKSGVIKSEKDFGEAFRKNRLEAMADIMKMLQEIS
jgi:5S rRNA maturation endonuclease (ribonuclease M5)